MRRRVLSAAGLTSTTRKGYQVALLGVALYVVLDAVAQLLPPHYSPISQAESDLAVGPYGYVMTLNFINRGVLSLAFIWAFKGTIADSGVGAKRFRAGMSLLGAWAVGAVLLAIFPTDVPPTPVSWHGAIHLLVAIIAFLCGAFGTLKLSLGVRELPPLTRARGVIVAVGILSVFLCIVDLGTPFFAPRASAHYGGLFERLFLGSVLLWIAMVSAFSLSRSDVAPAPQSEGKTA